MHISIIATDFDGTISQDDQLAREAGTVLRRWRETGRFTVLVSGRPLEFLQQRTERCCITRTQMKCDFLSAKCQMACWIL
jgi:ribonucleotide monophosphatase NagD (HAD superfamily)